MHVTQMRELDIFLGVGTVAVVQIHLFHNTTVEQHDDLCPRFQNAGLHSVRKR